jgi:hypothetical protein
MNFIINEFSGKLYSNQKISEIEMTLLRKEGIFLRVVDFDSFPPINKVWDTSARIYRDRNEQEQFEAEAITKDDLINLGIKQLNTKYDEVQQSVFDKYPVKAPLRWTLKSTLALIWIGDPTKTLENARTNHSIIAKEASSTYETDPDLVEKINTLTTRIKTKGDSFNSFGAKCDGLRDTLETELKAIQATSYLDIKNAITEILSVDWPTVS